MAKEQAQHIADDMMFSKDMFDYQGMSDENKSEAVSYSVKLMSDNDSFNSPSTRVAEGFNVYADGVLVDAAYSTTYQVTGGGEGCYTVTAFDLSPAYESEASNEACVDAPECSLSGDSNGDGSVNVADIVALVNQILYSGGAVGDYLCGDGDNNGTINVADIVSIVNIILYGKTAADAGMIEEATKATFSVIDNAITIEANGFVQGVQMTLSHGDDFSIELVNAYVDTYVTSADNKTTLVVVTDGTTSLTDIATFEGDNVKVESSYAVNSLSEEVVIEDIIVQLADFDLKLTGPNPFNPTTSLDIVVPEAGYVSVNVYNILGQEVATLVDGYMEASPGHSVTWDAGNLASGVYFVRAITANQISTQKLMLLK